MLLSMQSLSNRRRLPIFLVKNRGGKYPITFTHECAFEKLFDKNVLLRVILSQSTCDYYLLLMICGWSQNKVTLSSEHIFKWQKLHVEILNTPCTSV